MCRVAWSTGLGLRMTAIFERIAGRTAFKLDNRSLDEDMLVRFAVGEMKQEKVGFWLVESWKIKSLRYQYYISPAKMAKWPIELVATLCQLQSSFYSSSNNHSIRGVKMSNLDGQSATGLFQNYESDFQLAYDELVQKIEEIPTLTSGMPEWYITNYQL